MKHDAPNGCEGWKLDIRAPAGVSSFIHFKTLFYFCLCIYVYLYACMWGQTRASDALELDLQGVRSCMWMLDAGLLSSAGVTQALNADPSLQLPALSSC